MSKKASENRCDLPRRPGIAAPFVAALVVALGCGACSMAPQHEANAADLEASYTLWDGGQLQQAAARAERVLARTGSPELSANYARQRYYASVLMMLAHESASFGEDQFATEGKRYLSHVFGATQGSPSAHLVAAAYYASHGRLVFEKAQADGESVEGENGAVQQIPAALSAFDLQAAQNHLNLTLLMVYTRLGFTSRSNDHLRTLDRVQHISDLDTCNEFMASAQVSDSVRPWIYYTIFRYLTATGGDEKEAYRFGISARSAAGHTHSGFDQGLSDAIADWIDNDSTYVFSCACPKPFDRSTDRCLVCGAQNIIFEGNPKP